MTIFTIGFTKKSAQRFFSILTAAGVKRIVDVRLSNVTQLSGFSKRDDLAYFAATWPSWHPRKTSSIRIASRAAAVARGQERPYGFFTARLPPFTVC